VDRFARRTVADLVPAARAVGDDQVSASLLRTRGSSESSPIFIETS
jgi:hypothetical protein